MQKYMFTCPAPGCGHTMNVDAANEDEALEKLLVLGDEHGKTVHPQIPQMSPEDAKTMVRVGMKRDNSN